MARGQVEGYAIVPEETDFSRCIDPKLPHAFYRAERLADGRIIPSISVIGGE